ncbi:TPA: InlB B-repeat-containing protein [Listeria monocytogenes]|uniref:InlB B-repeat-containing protein n=1 Tax=Listeria monocytogenes TaxID=1639 RepID=UPI00027E8631|nr:InlB B-repeat-containing protein [Listeria monocytogenes]EAD0622777.1 internalin [Listeria monocytogenes]CBY76756.1 leucine-rich repeat domain protein (LPXTG motif) [Listeria monocytogenes SLCC2540]HAC3261846.1 internalin [Listeria monocytogenes]HCW3270229.1 InlB B-repeat-containing protein [Listeria monocytogenes]
MKGKLKFIILTGAILFQSLNIYPLAITAEERMIAREVTPEKSVENTDNTKGEAETTSEEVGPIIKEETPEEIVEGKVEVPTTGGGMASKNLKQMKITELQQESTYATVFPDEALSPIIAKAATGSDDVTQKVTQTALDKVTTLTATSSGISNLTGVDLLTNVINVSVSGNQITDISPLTNLPNLVTLNVSNNQLDNITLSAENNLPKLTTITSTGNNLVTINIQDLPKFQTLTCDAAGTKMLSELTLRNLPKLYSAVTSGGNGVVFQSSPNLTKVTLENLAVLSNGIYLTQCGITDLIIKDIPFITNIQINRNQLTTLEKLENLPAVKTLQASTNKIAEFENMQTLPNLTSLYLSENSLTELIMDQATAEKFPKLSLLEIMANSLTKIDIQKQPQLQSIYCDTGYSSKITEVTLKSLPRLTSLSNSGIGINLVRSSLLKKVYLEDLSLSSSVNVTDCGLEELVIRNLPKLTFISAYTNQLTTLEGLENLPTVSEINVSSNKITELENMHSLPNLKKLTISSNKLTSLVMNQETSEKWPNLENIYLTQNELTKFDVQNQPKLKTIAFNSNYSQLTEATLKNLPQLTAASVSNLGISFTNSAKLSKVTIENLPAFPSSSSLTISSCNTEELVLKDIPLVKNITLSGNKLSTLDGLENLPSVTSFNVSENELTDTESMPTLPNLSTLTLSNNHISALPETLLTKAPVLTTLNASNQTITLPKKVVVTDLVLDNPVHNLGVIPSAKSISNQGTYQNNQITWLLGNIQYTGSVSYQFNEPVNNSVIKGTFSGKVNQPIKASSIPVITANKEVTYAKNTEVTETEFLKDISASVTGNATLSSDFDQIVDFGKAGSYEVTLNATNSDGVEAVPVKVTVHVAKSPAPVITADQSISYIQNTEVDSKAFLEAIHATTNDGSPISSDVETAVKWAEIGDYPVTLRSTNEDGVEAVPVKVMVHIEKAPVYSYTVYFDIDGNEARETIQADALLPEPAAPTKEGYTFTGWYDSPTGGTEWDFETDKMPANDMTLYAQFTINQYTAKLDAEGTIVSENVTYNELVPEPAAPTREGYTFTGWYDAPTDGTKWDFETDKMPANDMTLYARFTINQYIAKLDAEGTIVSENVTYNELVPEQAAPSKEGYTFTGWYDSPTGGIEWDFETDKMPAKNITLYARFEKNSSNEGGADNDGGNESPDNPTGKSPQNIDKHTIISEDKHNTLSVKITNMKDIKEGIANEKHSKLPSTGDDDSNFIKSLQAIGCALFLVFLWMRLSKNKKTSGRR